LGELFLEKMEISKSFFGKNHGKLAHLWNLAPKIIYALSIPQYPTYKSIEIFTTKTNIYTYQYSQLFTMK
jgi:hypothetical protein